MDRKVRVVMATAGQWVMGLSLRAKLVHFVAGIVLSFLFAKIALILIEIAQGELALYQLMAATFLIAFSLLLAWVFLVNAIVMTALLLLWMSTKAKEVRAHVQDLESQAAEAERSLLMTILGQITAMTHNKDQERPPWSKN